MAISLKSLTRKAEIKPPRILVYGVEGIGKTTFAANAPNPVFIWTEEGRGLLDVASFPVAKSYDAVMEAMQALAEEKHDFNTVVIDTLDWLEPLVWQKTCEENSKDVEKEVNSIEDFGYGKGYVFALEYWRKYIDALNWLRDEKNMAIIQIAHSQIVRFDSPETEPYDRYTIKLHKSASAKVREFSDVVAFANYKVNIAKAKVGFDKKVSRGVGGQRKLHLQEKPAYQAKNRYNMPDECELDWNEFAYYMSPDNEPEEPIEETEVAAEPQEAEQQAQEPKKKEKAA